MSKQLPMTFSKSGGLGFHHKIPIQLVGMECGWGGGSESKVIKALQAVIPVAQLVGHHPTKGTVAGSISNGLMFLSLSLSLPFSLKIKK